MADISKIEGYDLKDATARASISSLETEVATKQNTLVSGTNIKTVNGTSILGSGNIITPNTTYGAATTSANGLMSSTDKSKLDGIASGATKVTVDGSLSSSSTNPVQNKVINAALETKQVKSAVYSNISVSVTPTKMSSYQSWDTENKYGYSASIAVSGLTVNSMVQNIVMTDTLLNSVAPIVTTNTDSLIFYVEDETALSGTIYTLVTSEVS